MAKTTTTPSTRRTLPADDETPAPKPTRRQTANPTPKGGGPVNKSTKSQAVTGLEDEGGTEQPHPTLAARAGRSSTTLPPPGRSHDDTLQDTAPLAKNTRRVRATQEGYYNHIRRREGDIFTLVPREGLVSEKVMDEETGEQKVNERTGMLVYKQVRRVLTADEQFSENWMEDVDPKTGETKPTTAQQALDREQARIRKERQQERGEADEDAGTGDEDVIGD